MEQGQLQADDPQFGLEQPWPKSKVSRTLSDGEQVRVGPIVLTAHLTPGHTYGGTSWSWRSCEAKGRCANMVFADSVGAVTNDTYRYSDHPKLVAALRNSIEKIGALPCDILLTGHPVSSSLYERLSGKAPLVDSKACQAYAERGRKALAERLEKERAAK
jgi:metallo-beta-lactamase class B